MGKKIILGTFDAEKYWRDKNYTMLPYIEDKNANNIVMGMDELLFPLCGDGDILVTRYTMNPVFKQYLNEIGFNIINNNQDLHSKDNNFKNTVHDCVFKLLHDKHENKYFKDLLNTANHLESYAVLPETKKTCEKYNISYDNPDVENIKKVNSKIYSHELNDKIKIKKYGTVIKKSTELEKYAGEYITDKGFLIKDAFGVSGKGNILINSQNMLKRITKYLSSQEDTGLNTCFVIEPYLNKKLDFSCQLKIYNNGNHDIISIQKIINNGFSYLGSLSSDKDFDQYLDSKGYFKIINDIAVAMYQDGYYGDVCIDSMILDSDEIVPIVEINARKSMGLINYYIDRYLNGISTKGHFIFFSVGFKGDIQFIDILNKLEKENLLFKLNKKKGIIPLSSKTIFINRDIDDSYNSEKVYKGRFYISSVSDKHKERISMIERTKEILKSLNFNIYN